MNTLARSGHLDVLALPLQTDVGTSPGMMRAERMQRVAYGCCLLLPVACLTSTTAATVLHLAALALLGVERWILRTEPGHPSLVRLTDLERPLALYIVAYVVSSAMGVDPTYSFAYSTELRRILIAVVVANVVRTPRQIVGLAAMIFLAGLLCTGMAWQERFIQHLDKPQVFSSTPNDFAVLMMLCACMAVGYATFLDQSIGKRVGLAALAAVLLYGTMLPNCRSAILGAAIGVAGAALVLERRKGLILIGLIVLVIPLIPSEIMMRMGQITDFQGVPQAYRIRTADLSWKIYRDYPIFGIGRRNFTAVVDRYKRPEEERRPNAHDNYINVLVEMGPLGLIALVWLQIAFVLGSVRRYRRLPSGSLAAATQAAVLCAFTGFAIAGLTIFDWGYLLPVSMLWILIGLAYVPSASPDRGPTP